MTYYLGRDSDTPLTAAWSEASPGFYVSEPEANEQTAVHQHLPFSVIRFLGTHTGCGCGFRNQGFGAVSMNPDDIAARQSDQEALAAYLHSLPKQTRPMQIYNCWSGDESIAPEHFRTCSIADLASPDFAFRERELITLST